MPRAIRDSVARLLAEGARNGVFPGAVWAVGDLDGILDQGACGLLDPAEPAVPMRLDTIFDLASLTKIIAVWSVIGSLWEDGSLDIAARLARYLPDLDGFPLADVTVHHLLTHTSGVPLRANLRSLYGTDPEAIERGILQEDLFRRPGEVVEYTDRSALVLGFLAGRLAGADLGQISRARVWDPLKMITTRFGPLPADLAARCAPTEWDQDRGHHLKGIPHDFSARLLSGTCGSAGTFSTVAELGAFLRYVIGPDQAPGRPGFGAAWIKESLKVHTGDLAPMRGLLWHPAARAGALVDVWAHFGFTGTAMWVSPRRGRWAVLLTNKLYYTRDSQPISDIRTAFSRLAFD